MFRNGWDNNIKSAVVAFCMRPVRAMDAALSGTDIAGFAVSWTP